jgi:hypothetical protein
LIYFQSIKLFLIASLNLFLEKDHDLFKRAIPDMFRTKLIEGWMGASIGRPRGDGEAFLKILEKRNYLPSTTTMAYGYED